MIEREVARHRFRRRAAEVERLAALLDINRPLLDRAEETFARRLPMKRLPRVEREREIEVGRGNFHRRNIAVRARRKHFAPAVNSGS